MQLNSYLLFDGQCEAAFKYYEKHLGGTIDAMMNHAGTPAESGVPAEWREKILHARMTIDGSVLMASDAPPGRFEKPQGFSVNIGITDIAKAETIFKALSDNGKTIMPLQQTFWAKRFGMCVDQFGIPWMVNCE